MYIIKSFFYVHFSIYIFRIYSTAYLLFHLVFISVDCSPSSSSPLSCSSCKQTNSANDVNRTESFKNLSGNALEETVIDVISQRSKINSQRIELRHLEIPKITKNMLKNATNISSIDFQSNKITEIENGSFDGNEKLEKIDLMANCLTEIAKELFSGDFPELHEINLSFNAITVVETASFDHVVKLKSIDLSNNCIRHLHSNLFRQCNQLREVHLQGNEIEKIEFHLFESMTKLNLLNLSYNSLETIPHFRMRRIKSLILSHNNITKLNLNYKPHERMNEAEIVALDVSFNRIVGSETMSGLRSDIKSLDASHNHISSLHDFPTMSHLEILQLSGNNLTTLHLHKLHENFPSLLSLNLTQNYIKCSDFKALRKTQPKISISIDVDKCQNISTDAEHENLTPEIINAIQSKNDEILKQLKLNRVLLITLLSAFIIVVAIPTVFLLYNHCFSIKHTKENLIEQIEL